MFNQNAISNLKNKYGAVLRKCHLLNTFGSLAVAGLLCVGTVGVDAAWAKSITGNETINTIEKYSSLDVSSSGTSLTVENNGDITVTGTLSMYNSELTNEGTITTDSLSMSGSSTVTLNQNSLFTLQSSGSTWDVNDAITKAGLTSRNYAVFAIDIHSTSNDNLSYNTIKVGTLALAHNSTMNFGNNSLLVVNAAEYETDYALTASQINVESGASLLVSNVTFANKTTPVTVNIASGDTLQINSGAWGYDGSNTSPNPGEITASGNYDTVAAANANKLYFDNAFTSGTVGFAYENVNGSGGSYFLTLTQVKANTVLPLLDEDLAEHIDDAKGTLPDYIDKASKLNDKTEAASTIESAAKMSVGAGVLASLSAVTELGSNAVANRSNLVASTKTDKATISQLPIMLADNSTSFTDIPIPLIADAATGNGLVDGFALWVQPLYQSVSADGFKSGNFDYGYDTDIFGVSLGADYTMDTCWRFGLAFHMGGGDTKSNNSDLSYTKNDFDYYGATLYSAYVLDNLSLSADIGYINTTNDVVQKSSVGVLSTGDFNAGAFSVGGRAQYKMATNFVDIVPYLGARLNYSHIDSFNTKDANGVVFHNESAEATTFGIPIGVTFAKTMEFEDFTLTSRAKVGVQFTMGDLDVEQRVSLPNVSGHATMESEVFDPVTFMSGVGLDFGFDNVNLALEYNLGASENVLSQQVMATFSYKF